MIKTIISNLEMDRELFFTVNSHQIKNNDIFYTDSNGLFIEKRKRNFREWYDIANQEPVSSNLYPVTSFIYIQDDFDEY